MNASDRPLGLRERKKARTRAAIQEHALRLFREQGYANTTVDQIAAAAEVSPATFFRYFPTKEDAALYDALDPVMIDLFRAQPAELGPTEALRRTLRESMTALTPEQVRLEQARQELMFGTPELRARMLDQFYEGIELLAGLAAERTGRKPDDFEIRTWAGAVVGVVTAVYLGKGGPMDEYLASLDSALDHLAAGLPL
ncbi:MAG TPA: TetR family transcriptional regulator [Kribbellaceae bacterium]